MTGERRASPWTRLGLRSRLTLGTTAVVAIGLILGAWLLVAVLSHQLTQQLDSSARTRASDVAVLLDSGRLPDPVPTSSATDIIQVVDAQGRVRAASAGSDRLVPLLEPAALATVQAGGTVDLDGRRLGIADPLRVVGVQAGPADDRQTVLVAAPVTDLDRSLTAVRRALLIAVPLLILASAGLCWLLVGSALRPVDALSRGADSIGLDEEDRLLPVPVADDELRRLASTLNALIERMRASTNRQRSFVSDAAHELRSPLASIRTSLEVSLVHPGTSSWQDTASGALLDVDRMSRLVDDLLLLARLDESGATTEPRRAAARTDVVPVLRRLVSNLPPEVPVTLTGAQSAWVTASEDMVTRVVTNLTDNARRYARTAVVVEVLAAPEVVTLVVSDDGPGIPAADRDRVFERFTRLDDARSRDSGGSGLGLAIVGELVTVTGGTVSLTDNDPGLVVTVVLPAAPASS